jgi:geranylgeranyl pyrophosphate synthase
MNMEKEIINIDKKMEGILKRDARVLSKLCEESCLNKGKRLRARLFLAFCGKTEGKEGDIACAIELLHMATLIHDDILDNSVYRRGKPALYHRQGMAQSVLYGDYLFAEAFKLISAFDDPGLTREMVSALSLVLKGEIIEQRNRWNMSLIREDYLKTIEMKSGVLFGFSARLGALRRRNGKVDPTEAYKFGVKVGSSFQLLDDYSDYFGKDNGKKRFNDIREGVVTLPFIELLTKVSSEEKAMVKEIINRKRVKEVETSGIMKLMKKYNIALKVLGETEKHLEKARKIIDKKVGGDLSTGFDIILWIEKRIADAREEHSDSRGRVCGNQRPKAD